MNIILFIIAIVLILKPTEEAHSIRSKISNGELALPGEFPFVVAILGHNYFLQCTGTLVTWNQVLTAAHCFHHSNIKVEYCLAGENYALALYYTKPMQAGQKRQIVSYIMHPEAQRSYNENKGMNYADDIAILKVDKPFIATHSVALIELGTSQLQINEKAVTLGFGCTIIDNGIGDSFLRSAHVDIASKSPQHKNLYIIGTNKNLVSHGDSGGQLIDFRKNIIYGLCCGRAHDNTVSYYVNLAEHHDWIKSQIDGGGYSEYSRFQRRSISSNCEIIKASMLILFFLSSVQLFFVWS